MRFRRLVLLASCSLVAAIGQAQDLLIAKQLIKDAEAHCENIQSKDARGYWLAQIAETWQPADKAASLTVLERAAKSTPSNSWAWSEILRVWASHDADAAFQHALTLKSTADGPQLIGEALAEVAVRDIDRATKHFMTVPSTLRQQIAQAATRDLALYSPDSCEAFIQGLPSVNRDPLYKIFARECADSQLSLKAALKAGKDASVAMADAVAKLAKTDPAVAYGVTLQITDPFYRALAQSHCAEAFLRTDPEKSKQIAVQVIDLYNQLPPEWPSRPHQFVALESHLTAIDSSHVRDFIQRYVESVQIHFTNATDEEYVTQPAFLLAGAAAWCRLEIDKARELADKALQIEPEAGIQKPGPDGIDTRPLYRRYLVELAKSNPEEASMRLQAISGSRQEFSSLARGVLTKLLPDNVSQARQIAKDLSGNWPNFVEVQRMLLQPNAENASDALLRLELDSIAKAEFWTNAEGLTNLLLQTDPYRAVKAINLMRSRTHRIPLLSHVIVSVANTNVGLATSLFEGAMQDINLDMPSEEKVHARLELAKAAIALRK